MASVTPIRMTTMIQKAVRYGMVNSALHVLREADAAIGSPVARANYMLHRLRGKPYFGRYMSTAQGVAAAPDNKQKIQQRIVAMRSVLLSCDKASPFRILEIGSWAGWSAIIWHDEAKALFGDVEVVCVDPWSDYIRHADNSIHRTMKRSSSRIFDVFRHNTKGRNIRAFIGTSEQCLPLLAKKSFDVVYIDGDHSFKSAYYDITEAMKLVKTSGCVCGDDLDLTYDEVDIESLSHSLFNDYVLDPKTETKYHPGVTLAVHRLLGSGVGRSGSFWCSWIS